MWKINISFSGVRKRLASGRMIFEWFARKLNKYWNYTDIHVLLNRVCLSNLEQNNFLLPRCTPYSWIDGDSEMSLLLHNVCHFIFCHTSYSSILFTVICCLIPNIKTLTPIYESSLAESYRGRSYWKFYLIIYVFSFYEH